MHNGNLSSDMDLNKRNGFHVCHTQTIDWIELLVPVSSSSIDLTRTPLQTPMNMYSRVWLIHSAYLSEAHIRVAKPRRSRRVRANLTPGTVPDLTHRAPTEPPGAVPSLPERFGSYQPKQDPNRLLDRICISVLGVGGITGEVWAWRRYINES